MTKTNCEFGIFTSKWKADLGLSLSHSKLPQEFFYWIVPCPLFVLNFYVALHLS